MLEQEDWVTLKLKKGCFADMGHKVKSGNLSEALLDKACANPTIKVERASKAKVMSPVVSLRRNLSFGLRKK
jgi:hypothetical protein